MSESPVPSASEASRGISRGRALCVSLRLAPSARVGGELSSSSRLRGALSRFLSPALSAARVSRRSARDKRGAPRARRTASSRRSLARLGRERAGQPRAPCRTAGSVPVSRAGFSGVWRRRSARSLSGAEPGSSRLCAAPVTQRVRGWRSAQSTVY